MRLAVGCGITRKAEKTQKVHRGGKREDIGFYVRSRWEANMVRVYREMKIRFLYEPREFRFEGIERGNMYYTPDFYLVDEDQYVEVKGYLDDDSRVKLKRFLKYFPDEARNMHIILSSVMSRKLKLSKDAGALVKMGYRLDQLHSYRDICSAFFYLKGWEA